MEEHFICPHCSKTIEISKAFTHKIEEQLKATLVAQHKQELETLAKTTEQKLRQQIEQEQSLKLKDREAETKELASLVKNLQEQLLSSNKEKRELKLRQDQLDLEKQKEIAIAEERAKQEALKSADEENRLKNLEKEKKITDMEKLIEELKRKAQQGSMQTQGEVLELDLEETLKNTFPHDDIVPVGKGVSGADVKQVVKSPRGTVCGVILWEFKRTKAWSDDWVTKLKTDMRSEKAHVAAIVSQALPAEAQKGMGLKNGVWVSDYPLFLVLAELLRKNLLDIGRQKAIAENSADKAQYLYSYITGHEFRHQVEALVEVFSEMNDQIVKERIAFERSWKQREGQVKRLFMSTANMIGGMQGTGATLPQIKGLDLLEDELETTNELPSKTANEPPNLLGL